MEFTTKIKNYKSAGYTGLFVQTHEERRLIKEIAEFGKASMPDTAFHSWDLQSGLVCLTHNITHQEGNKVDLTGPAGMLDYLQRYRANEDPQSRVPNVFILKDFHLHFDKVINIRLLRNTWNLMKARGDMIIFVGHKFNLPGELEKEIQLVDYDLPARESIAERLTYVQDSANYGREDNGKELLEISEDIHEAAIEAARGMTSTEIENAFSMAVITSRKFDKLFVDTVFEEKIAQLKKGGLLTYIPSDLSFDNVGGLNGLKNWIRTRKKAYSQEAREFGLPLPKGMLLCSVPGVGKTLLAKATAQEFDCPLFQFDIGNIFDSHVGNSERNMREAIKVIESIGKCVILIDEIEKALSKDAVSGRGDTGVSSRIYGTLLSWLNDRTNPAFIVATSNDHTILPTPLIRKGRFDQLFWIDLPNSNERVEIFSVVLRKYGRDPEVFNLEKLANRAEDYTGAEIEEVVKSALFRAFDRGEELDDTVLREEIDEFIPFAVSHTEDLQTMRNQAKGKLVMLTDDGETETIENGMRKLSIDL
jgi:SpoVK/Ycf46/Vps4 family AAA+-type ATPase